MNEATISMMYYRYETNANLYNISIFDEAKKFFKGNKYKRLWALSDKMFDSFGKFERKVFLEEVEKKL